MANAVCERLIGTMRCECLDWLIPISESHLCLLLAKWSSYYNRSRPHMALGPSVPDPPSESAVFQIQQPRHRIADGFVMLAKSVLGGLHHEYSLVPAVRDRVFAEHRRANLPRRRTCESPRTCHCGAQDEHSDVLLWHRRSSVDGSLSLRPTYKPFGILILPPVQPEST
jgi:hypothetical protein